MNGAFTMTFRILRKIKAKPTKAGMNRGKFARRRRGLPIGVAFGFQSARAIVVKKSSPCRVPSPPL
jgi:hypothetical protein